MINESINDEKVEEKDIKEENNDEIIDKSEKDILVNNALYGAKKELKNNFIEKYNDINDYLTTKEYNSIANLLKKATPEVVSEVNIIFTFNNKFEVVLFDKNVDLIVKFLEKIYNIKYSVVAVTSDEWKDIKKEYIKNIKDGKKYEYIDVKKTKKTKKKNTDLENSIENIFGDEYKIEE